MSHLVNENTLHLFRDARREMASLPCYALEGFFSMQYFTMLHAEAVFTVFSPKSVYLEFSFILAFYFLELPYDSMAKKFKAQLETCLTDGEQRNTNAATFIAAVCCVNIYIFICI